MFNNNLGLLICSDFGYICGCPNAEAAELEGSRHALSFASTRNLSNVVFVYDCINVLDFIKGKKDCILWTNYQLALISRNVFCSLLFSCTDFVWVPRHTNTAAHALACKGRIIGCNACTL